MEAFERVRKWLAARLEISEEVITLESTLGDLLSPAHKTDSGGVEWALAAEFERSVAGVNADYLRPSTTIKEIAERVERFERSERESGDDHLRRQFIEAAQIPASARTVRVFGYIPELDAFQITRDFQRLASDLGLVEWHAAVWIGRLFTLDQDHGEHWFDNWDEREAVAEKARKMGIDPYSLMIINPERFTGYGEGSCNPPGMVKLFWTDVLKSLELSYELLFAKARDQNASDREMKERHPSWHGYIEDIEERIRRIQEGWEPPLGDEE
jgi:hypothetical protein